MFLSALCVQNGTKMPDFRSEEVKPGEFKVWVVMDRERLELPTTFSSLEVGKERVAKQVLARAKSLGKKRKVDDGAAA